MNSLGCADCSATRSFNFGQQLVPETCSREGCVNTAKTTASHIAACIKLFAGGTSLKSCRDDPWLPIQQNQQCPGSRSGWRRCPETWNFGHVKGSLNAFVVPSQSQSSWSRASCAYRWRAASADAAAKPAAVARR